MRTLYHHVGVCLPLTTEVWNVGWAVAMLPLWILVPWVLASPLFGWDVEGSNVCEGFLPMFLVRPCLFRPMTSHDLTTCCCVCHVCSQSANVFLLPVIIMAVVDASGTSVPVRLMLIPFWIIDWCAPL